MVADVWGRVPAVCAARAAPDNPAHNLPASAPCTVEFQGVEGELRARWHVSALLADERLQRPAVEVDRKFERNAG